MCVLMFVCASAGGGGRIGEIGHSVPAFSLLASVGAKVAVCRAVVTSCKCPHSGASHWLGLPLNLPLNTFAKITCVLCRPVPEDTIMKSKCRLNPDEPSLPRVVEVLQFVLYRPLPPPPCSCTLSGVLPGPTHPHRYPTCSTVGAPIPSRGNEGGMAHTGLLPRLGLILIDRNCLASGPSNKPIKRH